MSNLSITPVQSEVTWDSTLISEEEHYNPGSTLITRNFISYQMQARKQVKEQPLQFPLKPNPDEYKVEHKTCGFVSCSALNLWRERAFCQFTNMLYSAHKKSVWQH